MKTIRRWFIAIDNEGKKHIKGKTLNNEHITTSEIVSKRYENEGVIFTTISGSEYYCETKEYSSHLQKIMGNIWF